MANFLLHLRKELTILDLAADSSVQMPLNLAKVAAQNSCIFLTVELFLFSILEHLQKITGLQDGDFCICTGAFSFQILAGLHGDSSMWNS